MFKYESVLIGLGSKRATSKPDGKQLPSPIDTRNIRSFSDNGKSNKVTQCPKLKVFKLMEQKDLDLEKIKLLKQKHKEKKTKYSESRSKIEQNLYESSSTERFQQPRRKSSTAVQDKEIFDYGRQDVFETYEGQTKNGWYKDRQDKLKESPSRVSCALKKLLGSEYACVGCFALIFLVTVVAGLLLVFRVMSSSSDMTVDDNMKVHEVKGKRQSDDYDIFGGRRYREKSLDDGYQFPIYSVATDKNEFGYTDLSEQFYSDDITNIMNGAEIMDSDNEKLRDFYKKLIETDDEIKRVKQNLQINIRKYDKQELVRIKRSLRKTQSGAIKQRLHQGNKRLNIRSNRQSNGTDDGYGIVIQEQEVIVYGPKKSGKNNDRKFYKKHYKHSFCKHKQNIDRQNNMLKNNFKILKEEKNYFNNTETITAKYDRDNIVNAVQKDKNIDVPFKSNNNVDIIYLPSLESLNILSNITSNKGENNSQNSKNVNNLRRNIYAENDKYEDKLLKEISRKGRSLMSLEEEHYFTKTDSAGVAKNHYNHTNETDYGNNEYRLKRSLQYKTIGSNSVTTSNLNTLMNLTQLDKTSATKGISTVGNLKENIKKEIVHNLNKISRHNIEGIRFTTKSLTNESEVKREADNKLVLWDRVYNDKNSAKNRPNDGKKRNGGYIKENKLQKSKDWFKAQMHNLIGRRKKPNKKKKNYSNGGSSTKVMNLEESFQSIPNWRKIRTLQNDNDKDMDNIFKKLNAKLETVCREAAYAIQNTKNIKVRDSNADIATSTLMQRLVRMMRDLVDMQVQEKTCVELPPDLRQFLEWLVPPAEANRQADDLNPDISDYVAIKKEFDGIDKSDDVTDQPLSFFEDTDEAEVDKIQCMETIRAVQDLVDRYEGLSSDDKYKLSGVRDYLQRQLQYLNKLVGDIGTENNYQEADDRVKRETNKNIRKLDKRTKNSRLGYFMQRLRMKYNKETTQAINTSFTNNVTVKDKEIISYTGHKLKKINDVYNRPLEEAKNLTTEDVYTIIT